MFRQLLLIKGSDRYATAKVVIISLFTLIFCLISLVNHYVFRTAAYDLGIYNNVIYSYAHFKANYATIQQPGIYHIFSDHFEPIFMLFSPLYWVFGTYTLLIIQIVLVVMGGIGMMKFIRSYTQNERLAVFALAHFYTIWGIYSALAFDFHNNVTAAMLVPWLFYYFDKRRWKQVVIIFTLVLLCKENMALWVAFVCLGLAVLYRKDNKARAIGAGLFTFAMIYFICIVEFVIPAFARPDTVYIYKQMYSSLGATPQEMITTLVTKPSYLLYLLTHNHMGNPLYDGIKEELHYMVLVSGGIFMLYRPAFLLMLVPIYAQKLFINDFTRWGINGHYSIEFVPVICAATFICLAAIKNIKWQGIVAGGMVLISFVANIDKLDHRKAKWFLRDQHRFYQVWHYRQNFDIALLHKNIREVIPPDVSLSAQSQLCPHLCMRDTIYQFPNILDAEYIALVPSIPAYPLEQDVFETKVDALRKDTTLQTVFDDGTLLVLKVRKEK